MDGRENGTGRCWIPAIQCHILSQFTKRPVWIYLRLRIWALRLMAGMICKTADQQQHARCCTVFSSNVARPIDRQCLAHLLALMRARAFRRISHSARSRSARSHKPPHTAQAPYPKGRATKTGADPCAPFNPAFIGTAISSKNLKTSHGSNGRICTPPMMVCAMIQRGIHGLKLGKRGKRGCPFWTPVCDPCITRDG